MAIRIIAGDFGGRIIKTPDTSQTHPMGERERGAIFNALLSDLQNAAVLDLFAGSGALGLEALSRKAQTAHFVEKSRPALVTITSNIAALHLQDRARVFPISVQNFINSPPENQQKYDLIFADPPYQNYDPKPLQLLPQLLSPQGKLILSHPKTTPPPPLQDLILLSSKTYAAAQISIFQNPARPA
jgi:16S rRNA (guanine966-N2)-methyltransferase